MPEVLSRADLAARWDTSSARLANLACEGKGPRFFRVGTRVLYRVSDVLAYEEANMVQTAGAA